MDSDKDTDIDAKIHIDVEASIHTHIDTDIHAVIDKYRYKYRHRYRHRYTCTYRHHIYREKNIPPPSNGAGVHKPPAMAAASAPKGPLTSISSSSCSDGGI